MILITVCTSVSLEAQTGKSSTTGYRPIVKISGYQGSHRTGPIVRIETRSNIHGGKDIYENGTRVATSYKNIYGGYSYRSVQGSSSVSRFSNPNYFRNR